MARERLSEATGAQKRVVQLTTQTRILDSLTGRGPASCTAIRAGDCAVLQGVAHDNSIAGWMLFSSSAGGIAHRA